MSTGTIQIPVLFDMSGDTIVFGEEVSGDFVSSHLNFLLDMTTEANDISLNAADISGTILIGDQNTGDNLFYSGGTNGNIAVDQLCNRIAKAITRGKLVHIPKTGNHSNSGIPMGGRATLVNALGELGSLYATKYLTSIAPIGDEQMLGNAMARVASIHLVGSPLSAGIFQDATQIQTDLETASSQTFGASDAFYNALAVQLSKVLGGSKSSAPMNNGATVAAHAAGDLASQFYYENFEDNTYAGGYTTADIVSITGHTGSTTKAIHVEIDGTDGRWRIVNNSNGFDLTTFNTLSFWYKYVAKGTSNGWIVDVGIMEAYTTNGTTVSATIPTATQKLYINGEDYATATYTLTDWNHFCFNMDSLATAPLIVNFGHAGGGNEANDVYKTEGYFDEVRFFEDVLTTSQITNLATGANGNIPNWVEATGPLDASGVACPALKSVYEQLMNVPGRSQIMETRDISGVVDNSNTNLTGGFPFITGDKLVVYLRPKIVFAAQTFAEQTTSLQGFMSATTLDEPVFNVGRSGQGITGQSYGQSDYYDNQNAYKGLKAFDGVVTGTYGWLANNPFNATTGAYAGAVATSVDGANVLGSWVEVNVGKKVAVNNYKIYPQNWETASIGGRSPHIFKLIYSNDGTNFTTADSRNVGSNNVDVSDWVNEGVYTPKTFTLSENQVGQYWRLLVTSVYGNNLSNGGALAIQELELKGAENFTEKGDISGGAISDISGLVTNITATAANIETAFPGNATTGDEPETNKWGWIGSANSTMLTLETTDSNDIRTIDLHVWKITITL